MPASGSKLGSIGGIESDIFDANYTDSTYLVALNTTRNPIAQGLPIVGQNVKLLFDLPYNKSPFPASKIDDRDVPEAVHYVYLSMLGHLHDYILKND